VVSQLSNPNLGAGGSGPIFEKPHKLVDRSDPILKKDEGQSPRPGASGQIQIQ